VAIDTLLAQILDGSAVVSWGVAELATGWSTTEAAVTMRESASGTVVDGDKWFVEGADSAAAVVLAASQQKRPKLVVLTLPNPAVAVSRSHTIDPTRRLCHVQLGGAVVAPSSVFDIEPEVLQRAVDGLTLLISADAAGACGRLLEMTVQYADQRVAFGRRIAEYQVIKHRCADMCAWTETISAAVRAAANALDARDPAAPRLVSSAKHLASDLGARLAGEALQIHGGIGFTWDHDLHLYLRRLLADATLFGDADAHAELVVASLAADVVR
jgi:alkylation response protein AidB-like acyl-CoA dehydrogenase